MSKTYVHVNQHVLRKNLKHGTDDPVITVKKGKSNIYAHEVELTGPCRVIYGGNDKPLLSFGARVVIETHSPVNVLR